jgi:hypothetical protein
VSAGGPFEFVFGPGADRDAWDGATDEERDRLLADRFPDLPGGQLGVRRVLVQQLLACDPPAVWATARRLVDGGLDDEATLTQLSLVLLQTMLDAIDVDRADRTPIDTTTYTDRLSRLPLPDRDEIERALLDAAADAVVATEGVLDAGVAERVGGDPDDAVLQHLVETVEEHLVDDFGPLEWLPGGRTSTSPRCAKASSSPTCSTTPSRRSVR